MLDYPYDWILELLVSDLLCCLDRHRAFVFFTSGEQVLYRNQLHMYLGHRRELNPSKTRSSARCFRKSSIKLQVTARGIKPIQSTP